MPRGWYKDRMRDGLERLEHRDNTDALRGTVLESIQLTLSSVTRR